MRASGNYPHWPKIPAIENEHLIDEARVFANRKSLIASLPIPRGGKIAEIGVWQGAFSTFLIEELQPRRLFAFDIFTGHELNDWNGYTGQQLFDGLTHRQFYEKEMAPFGDITVVVEGPSGSTLRGYTDHSFDLVYVDGGHDYEIVKEDAEIAVKMVSPTGFLVFNDYIMLDPGKGEIYGIVPVVNDLVVHGDWRVVGYALNEHLFCDIALCRADHPCVHGARGALEITADLLQIATIENEHILEGARVFANRKSLVASLPIPRQGDVAEIRGEEGSFSDFLASELQPRQLMAFDRRSGITERSKEPKRTTETNSMPSDAGRDFDLVYVDAGNDFDVVQATVNFAANLVSDTGFLVFHDYLLRNPTERNACAVVAVVNDLVVNKGWRVAGYALQEHLYCNIALCRSDHPLARPAEAIAKT